METMVELHQVLQVVLVEVGVEQVLLEQMQPLLEVQVVLVLVILLLVLP
jgi:hypothetical protein